MTLQDEILNFSPVVKQPQPQMPIHLQAFYECLLSTPDTLEGRKHEAESLKREALSLLKIELPPIDKGGGAFSYLSNRTEPYRGIPVTEAVEALAIVKKSIPVLMENFYNKKLKIIAGLLFIFSRKRFYSLMNRIFFASIGFAFPALQKYRLKPYRYSQAVQEVHRLFDLLIEREGELRPEKQDMWEKVRDIVCIALEFDNAYRFRFQDILSNLNIEKIKLTKEDREYSKRRNDYRIDGKMTQPAIDFLPGRVTTYEKKIKEFQELLAQTKKLIEENK